MKVSDMWRQIISFVPALLAIYVPAGIFVVALFIVYLTLDIPFSTFVEDPAASLEYSGLTGVVSNVGILFQSAAAAVSIFGYILLRKRGITDGSGPFLLSFGLFTALLTIDDFFLIHEAIGDIMAGAFGFSDSIGEGLTFAVYVALFLFIVIKNRDVVLHTEYLLLCGAIILFCLSTLIDLSEAAFTFENGNIGNKIFRIGEDIIKFFAIITWAVYIIRSTMKLMKESGNDL